MSKDCNVFVNSGAIWGEITGNISDQKDLKTELDKKSGIQGIKIDEIEVPPDSENKVNIETNKLNIPEVMQELGQSEMAVVSQKAITESLKNINVDDVKIGNELYFLPINQQTSYIKLSRNDYYIYAFTNDGGIFYRGFNDNVWNTAREAGTGTAYPGGIICTNSLVMVYYRGGHMYKSTNGRVFSSASYTPIDEDITNIVYSTSLNKYMAYDNDSLLTSSDGLTWNKIQNYANYDSISTNNQLFVITGSYKDASIKTNLNYCEDGVTIVPIITIPKFYSTLYCEYVDNVFWAYSRSDRDGIYYSYNGK